jgi:hypothetical protein
MNIEAEGAWLEHPIKIKIKPTMEKREINLAIKRK